MGKCFACEIECDTRCSACKRVYFCSVGCQKNGWKRHKAEGCHSNTAVAVSGQVALPLLAGSAVDAQPALLPARASVAVEALRSIAHSAAHGSMPTGGVQGQFVALLQPAAFRKSLYSGVDEAALSPTLPRSLLALLTDSTFAALLSAATLHALPKAESVLLGLKAKYTQGGQAMDERTEAVLWPQIFGEALARALPACVRSESIASTSTALLDNSLLATPFAVAAATGLVEGSALAGLCSGPGWGVQAGPWCTNSFPTAAEADDAAEWSALCADDVRGCVGEGGGRGALGDGCETEAHVQAIEGLPGSPATPQTSVVRVNVTLPSSPHAHHLLPLTVHMTSHWRWVEPSVQCSEAAPALHELLTRMHMLSHELNRSVPNLRLLRVLSGSTAVRCVTVRVHVGAPSTGKPTSSPEPNRSRETGCIEVVEQGSPACVRLWLPVEGPSLPSSTSPVAPGYKVTALYVAGRASTRFQGRQEVVGPGAPGRRAMDLSIAVRPVSNSPGIHPHLSKGSHVRAEAEAADAGLRGADNSNSEVGQAIQTRDACAFLPSTQGNALCLYRSQQSTLGLVVDMPTSILLEDVVKQKDGPAATASACFVTSYIYGQGALFS